MRSVRMIPYAALTALLIACGGISDPEEDLAGKAEVPIGGNTSPVCEDNCDGTCIGGTCFDPVALDSSEVHISIQSAMVTENNYDALWDRGKKEDDYSYNRWGNENWWEPDPHVCLTFDGATACWGAKDTTAPQWKNGYLLTHYLKEIFEKPLVFTVVDLDADSTIVQSKDGILVKNFEDHDLIGECEHQVTPQDLDRGKILLTECGAMTEMDLRLSIDR